MCGPCRIQLERLHLRHLRSGARVPEQVAQRLLPVAGRRWAILRVSNRTLYRPFEPDALPEGGKDPPQV
jgi:hypothetical protein